MLCQYLTLKDVASKLRYKMYDLLDLDEAIIWRRSLGARVL